MKWKLLTTEEVEENYFGVSCYFHDLPVGTKFHTYVAGWTSEHTKLTKSDVLYREAKRRFPKPKSRQVYLLIPKQKYIDFCYENNYIKNSPSIQELIELHNTP
jgi:hypothetical protein